MCAAVPSVEEILFNCKAMHPLKSPIIKVVQILFRNGSMLKELNNSFITLIH